MTTMTMTPPIRPRGPLLAFGGPYSNLQALDALMAEAARLGIPATDIVCTGDVVAYGADAVPTIARLRAWGVATIAGNVERQLAAGEADCGCGFDAGTACDALSMAWYRHADRQVGAEDRAWMQALPDRLVVEMAGRRLAVLHGGASAINRFLFASTPDDVLAAELDLACAQAGGCDGVIAGHSGIPFTRRLPGGRVWHNAGVIGLPADDGTPRVWYGLISPTPDGLRFEHRPLAYDWRPAQGAMRAARLPEGYAAALETGLWPSTDVLPPAERAERGRPRKPAPLLWPAG